MSDYVAFIMDPIERVDVHADTSFAFMLACQARGLTCVYADKNDVILDNSEVWIRGTVVDVQQVQGDHYRVIEKKTVAAKDCRGIFVRSDPPFDEHYLTLTWLLSFAEGAGARIINSAHGLRTANEHLYCLHFPELCPATLITSSRQEVIDFVHRHDGQAIAKPIDGHAGFGVVRLVNGDSNMPAIIDMLTLEGKIPIMVQQIAVGEKPGDKRLLLVNGEVRGAVLRVAGAGDHRGNVHVGATVELGEITESDRKICETLGPKFRELGLYFVGIDVIGDKLIEVNVTSPTLVQELKRLGGADIAKEIADSL